MKQSLKLSGILLLLFTVIQMNCSKKKVENFTDPKKIFFIDPKDAIEVLQTEEPLAEKIGTISDIDSVEVVASIAFEKKDMVYKTYQIKCPTSIKHKCKTEFGYIREFDVASSDYFNSTSNNSSLLKKRLVVSEGEYNESNDIKKLILDPKSIKSMIILYHYNIFQFLINALVAQPDDRMLKTEEMYQIIKLVANPSLEDQYVTSLKKKYPFLNEVDEAGAITSVATNNDFEQKLTETRNELLNSYIAGFPLRSSTFKGLVGQFNRVKSFPYLTEKIFEYLSKEGVYSVSGFEAQYFVNADSGSIALNRLKKIDQNLDPTKVVALFAILNDAGTNFRLKVQILDMNGNVTKEDSYSLVSISAEESGSSLGFKVKTDKQDFILSPLETTPNLLIAGEGFKEYLKSIPGDYKDIIKNNDYEKAKMLIALKFGEGGFDEKLGKMVYILSASKRYWIMLDLFRFNPNVKRSTDYSGTLETSFSVDESNCISTSKWRQPKGELYITGIERSCYSDYEEEVTPEETMCFYENGSMFFQFEFSPSELRADKPSIDFKFENSGICQVIQHIM
ncbi:hypothetical protein EHQ23_14990 [Leptospira bourretii]|uniref:Uncharacterized protein n=1 Tax=Leptospira bourretii TaxID=2484962 RepID=A0A4R9IRT1_9LEPT|nr:hypothetical protein [Leptospira bourretii]TGK85919.1 hypothetical protein EHQ23_14990 [Leptospira bourretii]TGK94817.1 hypothetical protein EHQ26_02420 [Leptospira bourretii]TGL25170.1 hypothetical protein EHQ47_04350 [Leptospira bourretii]TGL33630.1 hypothetical protein EHQ45_09475 [Leptospira bourretii]